MGNKPDPIMPQIKNIVFLMLENRSLDNLLGWLYDGTQPNHVFPLGSSSEYDGLNGGSYSNPQPNSFDPSNLISVTKLADSVWNEQEAVPYYDPYEALRAYPFDPRAPLNSWKGVMNQFFGNQKAIPGLPTPDQGVPQMQGFLQDYYDSLMIGWKGEDILWTYTPQQLQVINSLARNFAVSDRWFSSIPTETDPNRAYSLCGTSLGQESNGSVLGTGPKYATDTLFNRLGTQGKSWKVYYSDPYTSDQCYTGYTFPNMRAASNGQIIDISQFYTDASNGTLPEFSYIEPSWTTYSLNKLGWISGTDYHPPEYVGPAENFLHNIFTSLRNGPQWKDTLFIVTFDEHGGTYDHVGPPWTATNPDGIKGVETGFDFNLFGARVPTLLISPYIASGTVFRSGKQYPDGRELPFDHTSFISTVLLWAGMERDKMGMGNRAAIAPSFEEVLSDQRVNDTADAGPLHAEIREVTERQAANGELRALMSKIPVLPRKRILAQSKTREDVAAAVALYWKEPAKFES